MRRIAFLIVSSVVALSSAKVLAETCEGFKTNAQDPTATVSQRYEAAKKYRRCVLDELPQEVQRVAAGAQSFAVQELIAKEKMREAEALETKARKEDDFRGLKWGVGFGFSYSGNVISEAAVVDGVIRATKETSQQAKALLEGHSYFLCDKKKTKGDHGCGPYVGVVADSNDVLAGVSIGFMWGWKSTQPDTSQGFSLGLGVLLENDVKDLADGFHEGEPLPPGETQIRFVEKGRWSAVIFATRTF